MDSPSNVSRNEPMFVQVVGMTCINEPKFEQQRFEQIMIQTGKYICCICINKCLKLYVARGGVVQRSLQREKDSGDSGKWVKCKMRNTCV